MEDQRRVEERQSKSVTSLPSRSDGVAPVRPSPAAPAWPTLIVIVLLGIGLVVLTDVLTPEGAWRTATDSVSVVLMFTAVAGWVRANRPALAQIGERPCESYALNIRYVASERHRVWRTEPKTRRRERVRLVGPRHVSPGSEKR